VEADINRHRGEADIAEEGVSKLNLTFQQSGQTHKIIDDTMTAAKAAREATNFANETNIKASDIINKSGIASIAQLKELQSAHLAQLSGVESMAKTRESLINSESLIRKRGQDAEDHALAVKERNGLIDLQKQQKELLIENLKDARAAKQYDMQTLNEGMDTLQKPKFETPEEAAMWASKNPKDAEKVREAAYAKAAGITSLQPSIGESAAMLVSGQALGNGEVPNTLKEMWRDISKDATIVNPRATTADKIEALNSRLYGSPQKDKMGNYVVDKKGNTIIKNSLLQDWEDTADRDTGPYNNPRKLADTETILKAAPALEEDFRKSNDLFYHQVLLPYASQGVKNTDIKTLRAGMITAAAANLWTPDQLKSAAKSLSAFVNAGIALNNNVKNFARYAIPAQTSYKSNGVDYSNPNEVIRDIISYQAQNSNLFDNIRRNINDAITQQMGGM
jgi:hypothetical protein